MPPSPDEGSDFGDDESESESESGTETGGDGDGDPGDGDGDGEGDGDEGDTGSTNCSIVVDTLTIADDTPPEAVECVEHVLGNLSIGPTTKLVDLSMLSNLREVGGTIYVFGNGALTSLHGLEELVSVDHLHIRRNHMLVDLAGLDSLDRVDWITVVNNEGLVSVEGLPDGLTPGFVEIEDNDLLTNLDGLPLFAKPSVGSSIAVEVQGNPSLVDLGGLSDCCSQQAATLYIANNASLTNLVGLESFVRLEALHLRDNFALASLDGLSSAIEVGTLEVRYDHCNPKTPNLSNLAGALSLSSIDVLQIQWVGSLTSLAGLEQIPSLDKLLIRNNAMLPWLQVQMLITQTSPAAVDACGGIGGPECPTEPCETF